MRKKLLTLGALALAMSMDAQFLSYVGDKGQVFVKEGALVFNGGGIRTVGTGVVDNSGNIMVVGGSNDKFATVTTAGANKTDGGNFILRMTNQTIGNLRYGQLYINGLTQDNITGIVDKEYKDAKHGEYQQIALPFYNKKLSDLNTELGKTFSNTRWSKNEILVWDNQAAQFDLVRTDATTDRIHRNYQDSFISDMYYYAIGSAGFDASSAVRTVKGVPIADSNFRYGTYLQLGGARSVFGTNGKNINDYGEAYNTYLQDTWAVGSNEIWEGDYGKNIYQLGNPFLTNLDLGLLATSGNIVGVRVEPIGVTTTVDEGAYDEGFVSQSTDAKYINYDDFGKAIGDVNAIIRPMQTFVVKTWDETPINFNNLRRFAYTPQENASATVTTGLQTASVNRNSASLSRSASARRTLSNTSSYVLKQLGVIALDAKGQEIGRTYYYVSPNAITGAKKSETKRQTAASNENIIGTFEEDVKGGYDEVAANLYWLYINEANENDFKGKEVRMRLYSDKIKSLKFEIREDAKLIADNTSLSNGESFYIKAENGESIEIKQGAVIAVNSDTYGLFYGRPESDIQKEEKQVEAPKVNREETELVFDTNTGEYKLLFASNWETARVTVVNLRGRIVVPTKEVSAKSDYVLDMPKAVGVYVVRVLNEKGEVFSKKVLVN